MIEPLEAFIAFAALMFTILAMRQFMLGQSALVGEDLERERVSGGGGSSEESDGLPWCIPDANSNADCSEARGTSRACAFCSYVRTLSSLRTVAMSSQTSGCCLRHERCTAAQHAVRTYLGSD